jgi:hypothetical protein
VSLGRRGALVFACVSLVAACAAFVIACGSSDGAEAPAIDGAVDDSTAMNALDADTSDAGADVCVAFDDPLGPDATAHECECRVKCAMQTGGGPSLCECGAASFLQFSGGTTQTGVASCALAKCCKGEDACDCSDDPTFTCRPMQTAVASCSPLDYDESVALAGAFPPGSFQNVTVVPGCK